MGFLAEAGGKEFVKKVCLFTGSVSSKGLMREDTGYSLAAWQRGGARLFAGLNKLELLTELQACICNHTLIRPFSALGVDIMDRTELRVEFNGVK